MEGGALEVVALAWNRGLVESGATGTIYFWP